MKTLDEQLNFIEEIDHRADSNSVNKLVALSRSRFIEVRFRAVEALSSVGGDCPLAKGALLASLGDKAALVRLAAAESLMSFLQSDVEVGLIHRLGIESDLYVKCFIVEALSVFRSNRSKEAIRNVLGSARRSALKLRCYYALYYHGETSRLNDIVEILNARDYRARCAAVEFMFRLMNDDNESLIFSALRARRPREKSRAVLLKIEEVLKEGQSVGEGRKKMTWELSGGNAPQTLTAYVSNKPSSHVDRTD